MTGPSVFSRVRSTLLVGFAFLGSAHAQTPIHDPIGAEALFRQGLTALKAGDWRVACGKFQASVDLEPAVSTWVKVAKCHEHDGKLATAWYDYQRASKLNLELNQTEKRRQELDDFIRKAVASLEPRIPKLSVTVEPKPEGLQVYRDGILIAPSALNEELPVDPGEHEVTAQAPHYKEQRQAVRATEGAVVRCDIALAQEPPEAAKAAPLPQTQITPAPLPTSKAPETQVKPASRSATPHPRPQSPWTQRHTAFVLGGAGIIGLGVGAYFGIHTLDLVSDSNTYCDGSICYKAEGKSLRDRAVHAQNYGFLSAGLGAAALGIGVVLYATAPSAKNSEQPRARIESSLTPDGISVRGTW